MIFVIVIMIYYAYAHNVEQDASSTTSDLLMEAKRITSAFVKQGSPADWNQTNVNVIGLTDGEQRLVEEKLDMLANMTYEQIKSNLRTQYNFYFYLEDVDGSIIPINGGKTSIGLNGSSSDNLVSLARVVIYDSRLVGMVVHVWQ